MLTTLESPWFVYLAASILFCGAWLTVHGVVMLLSNRRLPANDPAKLLTLMQGFRRAVIGLAVASVGLAWLSQKGWPLALALGIGGVEILESSIIIAVLKHRNPSRRQDTGQHASSLAC